MIGPLSGDEAVYVANYAKAHPNEDVHHRDGGLAGPDATKSRRRTCSAITGTARCGTRELGEIAYKKLGWRKAALIVDDYSFPLDVCSRHHRRLLRNRRTDHEAGVPPPLSDNDYAPFIRQLPPPTRWTVLLGRRRLRNERRADRVRAGVRAGQPEETSGNLFSRRSWAPTGRCLKVVGAYVGGFGTFQTGGLKTKQANAYARIVKKWLTGLNCDDGFVYNYWNAAWALVQGLKSRAVTRRGAPGLAAADSEGRRSRCQRRRVAGLDKTPPGDPGPVPAPDREGGRTGRLLTTTIAASCRTWTRAFGRSLRPEQAGAGPQHPPCKKAKLPWQGKIKVVKNGVVTNQVIK